MDGRAKRKIEAMRRAQAAALDLFEARGYDGVTVEQIADAAEVGAATLYRAFGTKERIILWDEYDPLLFEAIAARLPALPVASAVLEALVTALDDVYASDRDRILRRARLILTHPALDAASTAERAGMRRGLSALLVKSRAMGSALEADVIAGALVATLEAAVEHWVKGGGRTALRHFLRRAFRGLDQLGTTKTS